MFVIELFAGIVGDLINFFQRKKKQIKKMICFDEGVSLWIVCGGLSEWI